MMRITEGYLVRHYQGVRGGRTQPVRIAEWIDVISARYAFLADLDAEELRYLACSARDVYAVENELTTFTQ